jgi:hypothetical protein
MTNEKIFVQINDERIELTGAQLEAFLADRAASKVKKEEYEAELAAKATQKQAMLQRLGLTEEEINSIL